MYNIASSATATFFIGKFWCLKGKIVVLNKQNREAAIA
jgi:hypothetical protein